MSGYLTFVYPGARFAPTEAELEARRNPASMFAAARAEAPDAEGDGNGQGGDYDDDALADDCDDALDAEEDDAPKADIAGSLSVAAAVTQALA